MVLLLVPAAKTLAELAETIALLVLEPERKKELLSQSRQYTLRYSFAKQAKKHLLVEKTVEEGEPLPFLDLDRTITR